MEDREKPAKVCVKESSTAALEREKQKSEVMLIVKMTAGLLNTNYCLRDARILYLKRSCSVWRLE